MRFFRHVASGAGPLAMMVALAAGSVWSVVIQWAESPAGWMAVLVALLIASVPMQLGHAAAPGSTPCGQLCFNVLMLVLATSYAQYLGAAGVVGRELGFDFLRTLREIGPELAFALARERAGPLDWLGIVVAIATLAAFAWLRPRRQQRR